MSSTVQLRMYAVETLHRNIASKEAELKRDRQELLVRTKLLQQEVEKKGGTTGDPLLDLMLRAGFSHMDPAVPKLRELEAKLKGKKGEFVAFRYSGERRLRCGGDIRPGDFEVVDWLRIGVLKDETFWLRDAGSFKSLTLPVEEYLGGTWPRDAFTVTLEERPQQGDFFEWGSADDQPPSFVEVLVEPQYAECLVLGDEALRAALKAVRAEEVFSVAAQRLHRLILQPTE